MLPEIWEKEFNVFFKRGKDEFENMDNNQIKAIQHYFRHMTYLRVSELLYKNNVYVDQTKIEANWKFDGSILNIGSYKIRISNNKTPKYLCAIVDDTAGTKKIVKNDDLISLMGVTNTLMREIYSIQLDVLRELKEIEFIRLTDKTQVYSNIHYPKLKDIIKHYYGKLDFYFTPELNLIMAEFIVSKLPFTEGMINKYKEVYAKYIEDTTGKKYCEDTALINPTVAEQITLSNTTTSLKCYLNVAIHEILTRGNSDRELSIKNKESLVRLVDKLNKAQVILDGMNFSITKLLDLAVQEIIYIRARLGDRVATKSEIENGAPGIMPKETVIISEECYKMLNAINWCITGKREYAKKISDDIADIDVDIDIIFKAAKIINSAVDWIIDTTTFLKDIKPITDIITTGHYVYPDDAPDEVEQFVPIKDVITLILRVGKKNSSNNTVAIATKIALQISKGRQVKLSGKQLYILRCAYEILTGKPAEKPKENKIKTMSERLLNDRQLGKVDKNLFAFKIIDSVSKFDYTKVSEKQANIIIEAYNKSYGIGVDKSSNLFEEKAVNAPNILIANNSDSDYSTNFDSTIIDESYDNFNTTNSNILDLNSIEVKKLPTVVEMSSLLGSGSMKVDTL